MAAYNVGLIFIAKCSYKTLVQHARVLRNLIPLGEIFGDAHVYKASLRIKYCANHICAKA